MTSISQLWNKYFAAIVWVLIGLFVIAVMYSIEGNKSNPNTDTKYIIGGIPIVIGILHGLSIRFPTPGVIYVDPATNIHKGVRKLSSAIIPRRNVVALSG